MVLEDSSITLNMVTNDANIDGNPEKHYITIFMNGKISADQESLLQNLEPNKCEGWEWMPFVALQDIFNVISKKYIHAIINTNFILC